jgi:hypothetical protein
MIQNTVGFTNPSTIENSFTVVGGSKGTQPTFNGSPLFTGRYVKIGKLVHFEIQVDMDNITSFGTGQYYLNLPFPASVGYIFRDGCLHDISSNSTYHVSGHVYAGSSELTLFSSDKVSSGVQDVTFTYNFPVIITTADNFHIAGTYITQ